MSRGIPIAIAAASTAIAIGVSWLLLSQRGGEDAGIVDDREGFREFLEARTGEGAGVLFGPMPEEHAYKVFAGIKAEADYDPEMYYRRSANLASARDFPEHPGGRWVMRTNSAGFREDEALPTAPDARIVVLGDSHTDGAVDNEYSFANVLEATLNERHPGRVIDVVNGGVGSHSFYNYMGAVSKYGRELAPDVIVVAVYGGNDFLGTLRPLHYFRREVLPKGDRAYHDRIDAFRAAAGERANRNLGQAIFQLSFLTHYPELADLAIETANALSDEMVQRAEDAGVELVFLYIPPLWDVQIEPYEPDVERLLDALNLAELGSIRTADAWADSWLTAVDALGALHIDLRPEFRAADDELYWHQDYHINIEGHRRAAAALVPVVEPLLPL